MTQVTFAARVLDADLEHLDPEVSDAIAAELHSQQGTLEMIVSESFGGNDA